MSIIRVVLLLHKILIWRPGGYIRSSSQLFVWHFLRAIAQLLLLLGLTQVLGAEEYGIFIATLAVASFFTPLANFGIATILVRDAAKDPSGQTILLQKALGVWLWLALPISLMASIAIALSIPFSYHFLAIITLVIGEVVATSLVDLLARAEQAKQLIARFGAWTSGLIISRLLAFLLYAGFVPPTVTGWMLAYGISSSLYALMVWHLAGKPTPSGVTSEYLHLMKQGFPFAFALFSSRVQSEFNKPVLAQMDTSATANLNIAQRITDMASLPLIALQESLWPRIYSSPNPLRQSLIMGGWLIGIAMLIGGILWFLAPHFVNILGVGFIDVGEALQWLVWLPALQVFRNIISVYNVNQSNPIMPAFAGGLLTSVIATPLLVSQYALAGAIFAMYLTEIVLILLQTRLSHYLLKQFTRKKKCQA